MKNKIAIALLVLIVLCFIAVSVAYAGRGTTTYADTNIAVASDWMPIKPDECFAFEHGLGYVPYDVHAWMFLGIRATIYAAHTNYAGVELFTGDRSVIVCNYLEEEITVKIVAK